MLCEDCGLVSRALLWTVGPFAVVVGAAVAFAASGPKLWSFLYRTCRINRLIFSLVDSEVAHEKATQAGVLTARYAPFVLSVMGSYGTNIASERDRRALRVRFDPKKKTEGRTVLPWELQLPVGLSAGFDYNGQLTKTLEALGFGFSSVGTVTNEPCSGNEKPRLGRLINARSLLVNKGLKNDGLYEVTRRLVAELNPSANKNSTLSWKRLNVGLSIGPTNSPQNATGEAQVDDVVSAFEWLCKYKSEHKFRFAWLELNISCPNNYGCNELTKVDVLDAGLQRVCDVMAREGATEQLWVKFPIEVEREQASRLLDVIAKHDVTGVIIGNLAKDRSNPVLQSYPDELAKCNKGNFSGLPTQQSSNELIKQAYCEFGDRLYIIGVGGIFTAQDAWEKITQGASAVQLITALVLDGPGVVAEINEGLLKLLRANNFSSLQDAVGSACTDMKRWGKSSVQS